MTTFAKASAETKAEMAIQMVILDAIEKGHTDPKELAEFMKTEIFTDAVKSYISMMQ